MRLLSFLLLTLFAFVVGNVSRAKTAGDSSKTPKLIDVIDDFTALPLPGYPEEARSLHLKGAGNYLVTFDSHTGHARQVVIVHSAGSPILDQAAVTCLRDWKVKPGTLSQISAPISFTGPAQGAMRTLSQRYRDIVYAAPVPIPGSYMLDFASTEGTFLLQIDETTGRVTSVRVLDTMGEDRLDIFVVRCLRLWRFRPHTITRFLAHVGF